MTNLSDKLNYMTPTPRSFYSHDDDISALFGFTGRQGSQCNIPLRTQASIDENMKNSPCDGNTWNGKNQETLFLDSEGLALLEDNHENFAADDEILAFSEEPHEKSPGGDGKPYVNSRDEQTSNNESSLQCQTVSKDKEEKFEVNSARLTLVDCSVICVPAYNGHVDDQSIRSPDNDAHFVQFAVKDLSKTFGQQTNNHHGVQRSIGEFVHLKDGTQSASAVKSIGKYRQQKSTYRGVTRHKWTGKFEAHLWDGNCSTEGRIRKGKQVYLGGYETAEEAARVHDLTALKFWGSTCTKLNFHISNYEKELVEMEPMSREELVTLLRRKSLSFTRGTSIYRGVTRNRKGHWQARIKVASSKKDIYLGTFTSEEEAAKAYDIAAIHLKGMNALTNFDISNYSQGDLKELESFPKPKRVRRSKCSTLISESKADPCSDESTSQSDSPLEEIIRHRISALLPDCPPDMMPS